MKEAFRSTLQKELNMVSLKMHQMNIKPADEAGRSKARLFLKSMKNMEVERIEEALEVMQEAAKELSLGFSFEE